jgi:ABC-type multidrug transport system fused ATPase/permease subunit
MLLTLFRLVELAGGVIYIDNMDISKIGLKKLREALSIIPQDPTLFTGTIRSNLDPFDECNDDELWQALRRVHMADKVASMDGKLRAEVAENGGNLSVGVRGR